ncbi:MAG: ABC transporter substrate-binding protein [Dehalococcoidia bacterium]|nr:ABC transporter substrate-binding protein [Dehalococcoidia bacterium]
MAESDYWKNFWRGRVTRRRLLGGVVLGGSGLAAASILGCGGGGTTTTTNGKKTPTPGGNGTFWGDHPPDLEPSDARREFIPAPEGMTGGMLRFTGFDALVLDTFDPHLTQFGPLYSGHSAVFSKLYKYVSHGAQISEPDLADGMPEIIGDPNAPTEYIIHLRKGVKFHDPASVPSDVRDKLEIKNAAQKFPGLPGRELTADDVIYSFERQKNESSPRFALFYRSSQYKTMEKIEKIDDYTIKITTDGPVAPLLHFLADTNAFIIPKEVVDQERDTLEFPHSEPQSRMIGTGPFMWGKLTSLQEINVYRNPDWFGWDKPELGRPYLDGYTSFFIVDNASNESLFRGKKLDVAGGSGDPSWVFDIKDEMPELEFLREVVSGWVNTRFKVFDNINGAPCTPWSDPRLRKAVHLAADRQQVMDFVWAGEAALCGPVGPAIAKWALPQEDLRKIPGYRFSQAEREEDLALAKQLYQEAGSPELEFVFADQPSYIPDFAPSFIEGLRQNLSANVKKQVIRAYPQIAEGLLKGCDTMIASWGFDNGWIDLDDWVYPYFHTGGPKNSFGVSDPDLDALLDAQRREFDEDKRREIGYQIQRMILGMKPDGSGPVETLAPTSAAFARLDYATLVTAAVSWPYYKNRYTAPWFGNNHWNANTWLDRDDPSYEGRE